MISNNQIGYFIRNNNRYNNTIIYTILTQLYSNLKDPDFKKIRYLEYIINLAAKAFLFRKEADIFKEKSQSKKQLNKLKTI